MSVVVFMDRTCEIRLTEADETCHSGTEITLAAGISNGR